MFSLLLNLLYIPVALLYLPVLLYQMVVLKKNRRGWRQRFGFVPRRNGEKPCIWIHAVSLGEVNATRRLVAEIESLLPDHDIVLSTTTDTGYAAALRHYKNKLVFRYPLDFSFVVKRALDRIRPNAVVLMELEVWPNFIRLVTKRGIQIGIANGRVTEDKSMRRFRMPLVCTLARDMFSRITWIAAQNERYAARFVTLGAEPKKITVTGTMKYDTAEISDRVMGDLELAEALGIDRDAPLIVAGSTGPGEENILLNAYSKLVATFPNLQLAVVPRKPERFDDVARLIESCGRLCKRRSDYPDHPAEPRNTDKTANPVILGDTMGELRKFYALADVVFVGRTLSPLGGSDLIEVAALAKPMCFGPHTENFADVAEKLRDEDAAVQINNADDLVPTLRELLQSREAALAFGRRAREIVRRNTGATQKTAALLCKSLGRE